MLVGHVAGGVAQEEVAPAGVVVVAEEKRGAGLRPLGVLVSLAAVSAASR
jgi:hypothetical protein